MMKDNEKWMKNLYDAMMKWLEASTEAADSQTKYNEWMEDEDEDEEEVKMEEREDWSNKFQDEWE